MARFDEAGDGSVKEFILGLFLLLLCVEQFIESFTVQGLCDGVPSETGHWNLHIQLLLGFGVSVLERSVSAVEGHLVHSGGRLCDSETTETAPELNVKFKFDLFVLGWNPQVKTVNCLLNHFFLAILDQLKVREHL